MKIKFLSLFILSGIFILGPYVHADEGSGGAAPAAAVGYNQAGFSKAEADAAMVSAVTMCPECTSLKAIMTAVSTAAKACNSARDATDTACTEVTSSFAREALSTVQEYGTMVLAVASANSACSQLTDALKKGNLLLQLYKGACTTAKGTCDSSCGSAVSGLQKLDAALAKAIPNIKANISSCRENPEVPCTATEAHLTAAQSLSSFAKSEYNNEGSLQAMGGKKAFCAIQAAKSMAGGSQQMAMAMQMALQTNNCDKQTSASLNTSVDSSEVYCAQHPTEAQCNCGLDNQKNTARCLCQLNPRSSGCSNGLAKAGSGVAEKIGVGNLTTSPAGQATPKIDINDDGLSDEKINFQKNADSGGSGIGGGGAGPSAGGGGSGNQLGPVGGAGGGGGSGKISGSALGGWGGGSAGGRFGGGSNSDENNALKKYLPGQKNDPKRKIAGSSGFGTEITGQGGKSNWDKVKERYKDNTPTLLGN